jgi:PEP-CTERM motif
MVRQFLGVAAGLAIALSSFTAATAATVTETYKFTLNDLTDIIGNSTAPVSPVTGSFTVTFDPLGSYNNETSGIVENSLNVPIAAPLAFSYFYDGNPNDPQFMSIGGDNSISVCGNGAGNICSGTNDFVLQLEFAGINSLGAPTLPDCAQGFSCGNAQGSFLASGYTSTAFANSAFLAQNGANGAGGGVVTAGVPEPASWAIMLLGVGMIGYGLRKTRRRSDLALIAG